MGLFNWFSKKRTVPDARESAPVETAPPEPRANASILPSHPPEPISLGVNSPMIALDHQGTKIIMDRDTYDYMYGERKGTDPAQGDIDEMFRQVTRLCILDGGLFQGNAMSSQVLAQVTSPTAIKLLHHALWIVQDPATFGHCNCLGGPTIECYAGDLLVAAISLQHGKAIRWKRWHHDAQLVDGERITQWLIDQGVDKARLDAIYTRGNNHLMGEPENKTYWIELSEITRLLEQKLKDADLPSLLPAISQFIEKYPTRGEPYTLRAEVNERIGQSQQVQADVEAAIERGVRNGSIFFNRARFLLTQDRLDLVYAACCQGLLYQPDHVQLLDMRGTYHAGKGEFDKAFSDWGHAIRANPDWPFSYLNRAQLYHQQGKIEQALEDNNRAIDMVKRMPGGIVDKGLLAEMLLQRGDARYDFFQTEEAEADFDEACRLHPEIHGKLGELWKRRGQPQRALDAFTKMIALSPDDFRGYGARAVVHQQLNQPEQALADWNAVLRLNPDIHAYGYRGMVFTQLERYPEALRDFNTQLERQPDDLQTLMNRAAIYSKLGEYRLSLEDRSRAYERMPDNPHVMNMLAWTLATSPDASLRDGPRALELAQRGCELTQWQDSNLVDTLAAACAENGKFDEAVRHQAKALSMPLQAPPEHLEKRKERLKLYQSGQPFRDEAK